MEIKLDKRVILFLILYIIMAISDVAFAILLKNTTWLIVAMMWICLAIKEYFSEKIIKMKNDCINMYEEHIKEQDRLIMNMFAKLRAIEDKEK